MHLFDGDGEQFLHFAAQFFVAHRSTGCIKVGAQFAEHVLVASFLEISHHNFLGVGGRVALADLCGFRLLLRTLKRRRELLGPAAAPTGHCITQRLDGIDPTTVLDQRRGVGRLGRTVDLAGTSLELPIVGGAAAFAKATGQG